MPVSRYQLRKRVVNSHKMYDEFFRERGVKFIKHFRTGKLKYPSASQLKRLVTISHIWKMGDRYEKLAQNYYGDSRYWWVIAWVNKRPAELTNKLGDVIFIPTSLEDTLSLLNI
tara:strand:- start:145 stop:486 length:342 start_codon:yes stop_codon:yes gene_type:complete